MIKPISSSLLALFSLTFALTLAWAQEVKIDPRTGAPATWGQPVMDGGLYSKTLVDRLELGAGNNKNSYVLDAQGRYGTDWNKLWVKIEAEGDQGNSPDDAELQLLFGRLFSPFFEWQAGVRHDFKPDEKRNFVVLGLQGLAPYKFDVDSALFISENGDASIRLEAEYNFYFTQRLVMQPRLEFNAAFSEVKEVELGRGFNNTELGLRLRYEIRREFAPYIGINWTRWYGDTADMQRAAGGDNSNLSLVVGIRTWF